MATVACPGCGLPRDESEVGATPCPVCASVPASGTAIAPTRKKHDADPTAGLPADVSELNAPRPRTPGEGGSRLLLVGTVTFLLGTLCGVGGVLGFQAIDRAKHKDEPEVATKPEEALPTVAPAPRRPTMAPMPHEPPSKPLTFEPESDSDPDPDVKQIKIPLPGHLETHEFNEPMAPHSVPALKKGEHVVLKGKVKVLRIHGLDAGAILDASELEASIIIVAGKIDGHSTLKLNAPGGVVQISAKIDGKSNVTIDARGGEVKFMLTTTPNRDGSKIDNGSTVSIIARLVEFKGDINGADTKVNVILTRSAILKITAIRGRALVEYKSQAAGWSPPEVIVGALATTATFRKIE